MNNEEKRKAYNKIMKTNLTMRQFIEQCKIEGLELDTESKQKT